MAYDRRLLDQLKTFVQAERSTATFACGGTIPVILSEDNNNNNNSKDQRRVSRPVTLRWDPTETALKEEPHVAKLRLPATETSALTRLLQDCQIASFGLDGKHVVDETYRKAKKMDTSQFCTDFSPYEVGICDAVAQVLMPSMKDATTVRGIKAELYKLNVYSGPSGKFQAHVDTPRSPSQFGSLVVCLPYAHKGGQLLVKHAGQTMEFDFSQAIGDQSQAINWAAFYSDCEHEVIEVTEGHRITLTYNLYFAEEAGMLAGAGLNVVEPSSLPLYGFLNYLLKDKLFMREGGILGIPCAHAYPHTVGKTLHCLPAALKGVDMAVFESVKALKLNVRLRPVLLGRYNHDAESGDKEGDAKVPTVVGTRFWQQCFSCDETDLYDMYEAIQEFDHEIEDITWISNEHKNTLPALSLVAHGNQAELDTRYSFVATLIRIPSAEQRSEKGSSLSH